MNLPDKLQIVATDSQPNKMSLKDARNKKMTLPEPIIRLITSIKVWTVGVYLDAVVDWFSGWLEVVVDWWWRDGGGPVMGII